MKRTDLDRQNLVAMLRCFRDAQVTLVRSDAGSGGRPKQMPHTWTPAMRELERCLSVMARSRPKQQRHVMARYVDPVLARRTMVGRVQVRLMNGLPQGEVRVWPQLGAHAEVRTFAKLPDMAKTNQYTCLVASWPAWVLKTVVEDGVEWLLREYRAPSEVVGPEVPVEMLAA